MEPITILEPATATEPRQSIAYGVRVERRVPSSGLRAGDLVLTHGMRVRIPEPHRYDPGTGVGIVTSARGVVENPDDNDLTGLIPAAWLHDPEHDGTPRWTVQGNDRATWTVLRDVRDTADPRTYR